jgi:D-aspartate ligase
MRRAEGPSARLRGRRRAPDGDCACVLGDIDLVRPLALAGIRSVVPARPGDPLWFSRYTEPALGWADAWTQRELLVERLMRFGSSQHSPPVLFYQGTADLLTVSRNRERLAQAFRFPIAKAVLVEELTDKAAFHALAERLRLPVPPTRLLRPGDDPDGPDLDLRFPLILKPVIREPELWSRVEPKAKALKVDTRSALQSQWPRLMAAGIDLLAQELIVGPESRIESYHTYVDERGAVVAEFTGRKIRTRPADFGNSTAVTITDAPDVAALGRDVVQRLGLVGVAKLDFKRTQDRQLLLLEVNPRFTLWHHPAAVAGLNIPAIVFADLTGGERPPIVRPRSGVRWCDPWEDAATARRHGRFDVEQLVSTLSCEAKSGLSRDDPMPFLRGTALPRIRSRLRRRAGRYLAR